MVKKYNFLDGDKLYQEKARLALPYLIRQAKAGKTIFYSDLAKEVDMTNPRNLGRVLGTIGVALNELGKATKINIPPIQSLVINKTQKLPGDGLNEFVKDFDKFNRRQKEKIVENLLSKVYLFQDWDWVLKQFELSPVEIDLKAEIKVAKNWKSKGESKLHKDFKEFISKNPNVIGLNSSIGKGETEHIFPSADAIDILFTGKRLKIGVEVKSIISDNADILRGIFQCVKYKSLIEAEQITENMEPNSRVILALQGEFPTELDLVKNLLGVEVMDKINIE